jgi:hypothetical protein
MVNGRLPTVRGSARARPRQLRYASKVPIAEWRAFVRNAGLVEYWRAKGWPDFCRPTTAGDFTCT